MTPHGAGSAAVCDTEGKKGIILNNFKPRSAANSTELQTRLRELDDRFRLLSDQKPDVVGGDHTAELKNIQEEKDSLTHCLAICENASNVADARTNRFEDIVSAHGSQQIVATTLGDLISARNVVAGSESLRSMGQISDEMEHKLPRDALGSASDDLK